MDLRETFTLIAPQLKIDPQELIAYAAEDTLGGYHIDESRRQFPTGSLWEVEGKILYALVRWLKPAVVAEIGGWLGCSAAHLALAVKANGSGKVYSVDNGSGGQQHGSLLPPDLHEFVTLVEEDGRIWLASQPPQSVGFLFEDADHSSTLTKEIGRLALSKMVPGGLMVNHDAAHDFAYIGQGQRVPSSVGRDIRDGLEAAGLYFRTYRADPSDCGVAITVIPGAVQKDVHSEKVQPASDFGIAPIESAAPQISDAAAMHHAAFGLTYDPLQKSDEQLTKEVLSDKREPVEKSEQKTVVSQPRRAGKSTTAKKAAKK